MFDLNKKEKPFTSFSGFGGGGLGLAGGGISAKTYVDDVFSTTLYKGNSNAGNQVINTGIDNTEKSLVWIKSRTTTFGHALFDTVRGTGYRLESANSNAQASTTSGIAAFSSNGITVGTGNYTNGQNADTVVWNFKAAPGFFDVVTWSGTNTNRDIAHNLGSVPGMVIVKRTDSGDAWYVYHRSHGATKYLELNLTGTGHTSSATWNNTTPTSSVFTVGSFLNATGATYVAYVFAHDDQSFGTDEDQSVIKCGTYTGTGGANNMTTENPNGPVVDLGFEPQWVMIKNVTSSSDWWIFDTMRGFIASFNGPQQYLRLNTTDDEATFSNYAYLKITSTGFKITAGTGAYFNQSGNSYIYMAIRRPNKPPEAAINVFAINTKAASIPNYISGFPVDFAINRDNISGSNDNLVASRLQGPKFLKTNATEAEINSGVSATFDHMNGFASNTGSADSDKYAWMFKRAPGFFDVVAYNGTGSNGTVNHNLESIPELMILRRRSPSDDWAVYSSAIGTATHLELNSSGAQKGISDLFNNTSPTASVFSLSTNSQVNGSGYTYIAYLFATLAGISKIGTFSGTGSANNIDCGFAASARFVLIKRTNGTGDWFVFDTTRGMVSGNDFFLKLNTNAAQTGGDDYIDPYATGFTINGTYSGLNASGGTYIFLAIA